VEQPQRYRVGIHRGRTGERRSMSEADYAELVTAAVILIWDNLNTHPRQRMRAWIDARADWLTVERLPAYAPELNAVGAWAQMKNSLGNLAVRDVTQLAAIVRSRLKTIQFRPGLIEDFLAQTGLTLEPGPR
jgi:transposase